MSDLISNLEKLNRKERFFLIRKTMGDNAFILGRSFLDELRSKFGFYVPNDAFVAMDYHLNWIFAAMSLSFCKPVRDNIYDNKDGTVDGTQEDIDLLIAFDDNSGLTQLIMLEAKGVGAYDNDQLAHKMGRFKCIFGKDGRRFPKVKPHFGLMSPHEPRHLHGEVCPSWLRVNEETPWIRMPIPERLVLFGCDEDGGPDQKRDFWTLRREQMSTTSSG
jgi:hypothetical protein